MKYPYAKSDKLLGSLSAIAAAFLLLAGVGLPAYSAAVPVAKGNRILGVDVNTAYDNNYATAFSVAKGAGMQSTSLVVYWDELETAPGVYQPEPNWLSIANIYYPYQNTQVMLTIVPIDTVRRRTPADISHLAMDDPIVIARFQALLAYAFAEIPNLSLSLLSIGNEVDIYLGTDPVRWGEYQRFFAAVAPYARALRPGLAVGVQTTYDGMVGPAAAQVATLNQSSDIVLASYYPMNSDFTVKAPTVVRGNWDVLLRAYPGRQVVFAQLGYPTGFLNNSSQTKQKNFITAVFETWDVYRDRVPLVMFNWLHDLPNTSVQSLNSYYGINDSRFGSFLQTLGLRSTLGFDKSGLVEFKKQAKARGW